MRVGEAELFVVGAKGEPYCPRTPDALETLARAIAHNRSAIHALCGGGELTLGTLVYTQRLGITPLGERYVVLTRRGVSEISVSSVQDAIIRHFDTLRRLCEREIGLELKESARDIGFGGAHFINFRGRRGETLEVRLTRDGQPNSGRANASIDTFVHYLRAEADKHNGVLGGDFTVYYKDPAVLLNAHCLLSLVADSIVCRRKTSRERYVEAMAVNERSLLLKPRTFAEQLRIERGERARVKS